MLLVFVKVSPTIKEKLIKKFPEQNFLQMEDQVDFSKIMIDEELFIIYDIQKVDVREMIKIRRLENSTTFLALREEKLDMTERTEQFVNAGLINYICPFSSREENEGLWKKICKILGKKRQKNYRELALNQPIVNTFFIYNLIYGDIRKGKEIENLYKKYRIDFFPNLVMTLAVDDFWEICRELNNRDRYRIKMQCLNIVKSTILEDNLKAVCCSLIGTEKIIILLSVDTLETEKAIKFIEEFSQKIRKKINVRLGYTITIGISNLCEDETFLWRAYEESFQAINFSFFKPKNSILLYRDIIQSKISVGKRNRLDELKQLFWKDLYSGIHNLPKNYYEMLFQHFIDQGITRENIKSIVINFVYEITEYLVRLGLKKEVLYDKKELLNLKIIRSGSMDDVQNQLYDFSQDVLQLLRNFKESNNDVSLDLVKAYIDKYYSQEICLENLASMSNMSDSYFSRKFKARFGVNYLKYLQRIRLENAAKLLVETSLSIERIAEMVGFRETSYFSRSFKKYFALSPHVYRKK